MRGAWVLAAVIAGTAMAAGCSGAIQGQARETAARDHGCPEERVWVERDATVGMDYAYWLQVCGRRRYYRYQQTSTAGVGSGRFVDDTQRFAGTPAAR